MTASLVARHLPAPRTLGGNCRPGQGCAVHAWVVTAPQAAPRSQKARTPWGLVHVKRNGALQTACGLPAVSWHTFFDASFRPRSPQACPACAQRVTGELIPAH